MSEGVVFSKSEADQILRRAAEIEGSEDTRRLSLDELRSIASEAGFGFRAVERAIAEAHRPNGADATPPQVIRSGLVVTRLSTRRTLPIQIGSEQLMRAVRLFQPYREGPAQVKLEEHQLTWRDHKGLQFVVTSGGGTTEMRVFVTKVLLRKGRWIGWVKSAADRLERLIYLVATMDEPGPPRLPRTGGEPEEP